MTAEQYRRPGNSRLVYDKATRTIKTVRPPLICRVLGHAWRTERRYSKPGGHSEIVEIVMDKHSGAICAAAAGSQGMTPRVTGQVCHRCNARKHLIQKDVGP